MNPTKRLSLLTVLALALGTTAPAQSFLDFETVPGATPVEGLQISTEFQAAYGFSFIMEDNTLPQLADVGAPRTAFNGFGDPDSVRPEFDVGRFFLTDDGIVGPAPAALLVNYDAPVSAASGDILDIDFNEEWTIEARDAMGNVLASVVLTPMGNGTVSPFMFDVGMPIITQLRIVFSGSGANIGLAFDNFLTISPGLGTGQANSAEARLEINRQGATGAGPFDVDIASGSPFSLDWSGPPNGAIVLFAGTLNPGVVPIPCIGSLDLGTAPTFSDILVVFDGTLFPQSLFFSLDATGNFLQTTSAPASAVGFNTGLQGMIFQPSGLPCGAVLTASFNVDFR